MDGDTSADKDELERYRDKVAAELLKRREKLALVEHELASLKQKRQQRSASKKNRRGDASVVSMTASFIAALDKDIAHKESERDETQQEVTRAQERLDDVAGELAELALNE